MSIVLPPDLPASRQLDAEGLPVLRPEEAGARSRLRVGLLNLMPDKQAAELQFARLLAGSPACVELVLLRIATHAARTTRPAHLRRFYRTWQAVRRQGLDGLIVTGAPLERLPFESVDFWPEFTRLADWAEGAVGRTLFICWAAQAALYHRHGVPKRLRRSKAFGVYQQQVCAPDAAVLSGLAPGFPAPVSRYSELDPADLPAGRGLRLLACNRETGASLVADPGRRGLYMLDHLEYGPRTLRREYLRDRLRGLATAPPVNDPADALARHVSGHPWRAHAEMLFRNWLDDVAGAGAPACRPPPAPWTPAMQPAATG